MENLPALRFAESARRLGVAARGAGLTVPAFRCPPRVAGAVRTIRRYPGGTVISVRLRGRPFDQVLADMVEGVLVANRVDAARTPALRAVLRDAAAGIPEPAREARRERGRDVGREQGPEHEVARAA